MLFSIWLRLALNLGGPDFCASRIFHGHTPAFPRARESPAQNEDGIQLARHREETWRVQPCSTSHTHFLTGGCFHPHEMRWINHCAQKSRSLDWLTECCQFVGGPKTILIEVCRCTSNSHLVTTESPRKRQESSKSSKIWCVV